MIVLVLLTLLVACESHRGQRCVETRIQCSPCTCVPTGSEYFAVPYGGEREEVCVRWEKEGT